MLLTELPVVGGNPLAIVRVVTCLDLIDQIADSGRNKEGKRVRWTGRVADVREGWFGSLDLGLKISPNTLFMDTIVHLRAIRLV